MQGFRAWILATADYFPSLVEVLREDSTVAVVGVVTRTLFHGSAASLTSNVLNPSAAWQAEIHRGSRPCDLLLCFGYPHKVDADTLRSFAQGGFNFHPSFLPAYRGRQPFEAMVADQTPWAAMSVHRMTERFDAGPVVVQLRSGLRRPYSMEELLRVTGVLAPHTLRAFLALLHAGLLGEVDQAQIVAS